MTESAAPSIDPRILPSRYETRPVGSLTLHPANPRRGDITEIRRSIDATGFFGAVLVQESTGYILAGNHRYQAAMAEGMAEVPCIVVDVDDDTAKRILLADNRIAEFASWDDASLSALLQELAGTPDALAGTGFTDADLDALLASMTASSPGQQTQPRLVPPEVPRTTRGDVWTLGRHRVMCGDCRDDADMSKLVGRARIAVAFTSPPYAEQRAYDEASGFAPIAPDDYVDWFAPVAANIHSRLAADGSWFVNIKPAANGLDTELYVMDLVLAHVRRWGWHFATEFVWERIGVPKAVTQRFKNQFEPIYQFAKGPGPWKMRPDAVRVPSDDVPVANGASSGDTNWADKQGTGGVIPADRRPSRSANVQGRQGALGSGARRRPQLSGNMASAQGQQTGAVGGAAGVIGPGMAYPGNRLPTFSGSHEALGHAAAFPVGLPEWFFTAYSDPGDVTLDPFAGSGSSLIAAENAGRVGLAMELSPRYVDLICARWESATGQLPVNEAGEAVSFL